MDINKLTTDGIAAPDPCVSFRENNQNSSGKSGVTSRPTSPITTTDSTLAITANGHSMASVDPSAGPEAKITFDIRARRTDQAKSRESLILLKNTMSTLKEAKSAWKAEPLYNFTQRATLYKAVVAAEAKFNTLNAFIHLEKAHVNYLDALSQSSFSPEEQHAMYSEFQKAMKTANTDRCYLNSFGANVQGCSAKDRKMYAPQVKTETEKAIESEKHVQKLLKDIQQPHAELKNNLVANLHYRHVQLSNFAKTEDERAKLNSDITVISSFKAKGGLDSLTQSEAKALNELFKDAQKTYTTLQNVSSEDDGINKNGIEMIPLKKPPINEQEFNNADAAVMTEIRKLGGHLKGPPELRKDLVATLNHKKALLSSAIQGEVEKLNTEIATLEKFLESQQLAKLTSKTAAPLANLVKKADVAYGDWQGLENEPKTVTTEASLPSSTAGSETSKKEETDKTPEEKLTAAKTASKEADDTVMKEIKKLLSSSTQPTT